MANLLDIHELVVTAILPSGDTRQTVRGVNVHVAPGEVVALIGESGAGKSTIALAALGYARPGTHFTGGSVLLDGEELLAMSVSQRARLRGMKVAYVAQSAAASLNPAIPIGRQIGEGLQIHRLASSGLPAGRVNKLLEQLSFPRPDIISKRYPQQLSGGQQQRAMTAMAMVCEPKLLVLDEPTTALDVTTQIEVLLAIKEAIRRTGSAAIYVSHDLAVVAQIADRIIVLRDGEIVEQGNAAAVLNCPRQEYTQTLLAAVKLRPAALATGAAEPLTPVSVGIPLIAASGIRASYSQPTFSLAPKAPPLVLHGVGVSVYRAETLALVGESGSGKTTLLRALAGLHRPSEGTLEIGGTRVFWPVSKRSKDQLRQVQIVFQSPEETLNPRTRVSHIIGRPLQFYFGMGAAARRERVAELLEGVGLAADYAQRFQNELSGGQRQRVAIARALAARPSLVLCDEILSALDTLVAQRILDLLKKIKDRQGTSFLFVSHDLGTVARIADRVAVMQAGLIVEEGTTAEVFDTPHHPYTQRLLRAIPELRQGWLEEVADDPRVRASIDRNALGVEVDSSPN
ncbi:ABC transporter ATP-binding protein [Mesorhizobium sp. M1329]|uniref:ABC transporter ATP-binding protein n=1 Tax=Mesorhizobium sp. M1329 TaxID=2957083 RepID=UPI003334C75F